MILKNQTAERQALNALVKLTTQRFHIQSLQVTFDVAWSPDCIDDRCYDYKYIADTVDFVFGMFYDTRSRVFTPGVCTAGANTPTSAIVKGYQDYARIGVAFDRMILGLPWYGYDYPCLAPWSASDSRPCPIQSVPFRGANCSDAAGSQVPSYFIESLIISKQNTSAVRHDLKSDSMVISWIFFFKLFSDLILTVLFPIQRFSIMSIHMVLCISYGTITNRRWLANSQSVDKQVTYIYK